MENNLKFNSAICTSRSQSERLLALGLKKETADMYWVNHLDIWIPIADRPLDDNDLPAWSLARLIEMVASKWQEYMVFLPDAYDEIISDIEIEIGRGDFPKEYLV